jgi:hypothetical protein
MVDRVTVTPPEYEPTERVREYAWHYLSTYDPDPIHEVDPEFHLGQHPDDLPEDWQRFPMESNRAEVVVSTWDRVNDALNRAVHFQYNALYLAGWTYQEIRDFDPLSDIQGPFAQALKAAWNFRRFGFRLNDAQGWHALGFQPAQARVYADAGKSPLQAAAIRDPYMAYLDGGLDLMSGPIREMYARTVLIHLNLRVAKRRALAYAVANINYAEVPEWERRRVDGEDTDSAVDALIALAALPAVPKVLRDKPNTRSRR